MWLSVDYVLLIAVIKSTSNSLIFILIVEQQTLHFHPILNDQLPNQYGGPVGYVI